MGLIGDNNFITIQGWMVNDLNLKGNELLVYAIIYGFSQDNESVFQGSRQYLADWCNCSTRAIQMTLNSLTEKGLITKYEHFSNGQKFCSYATNFTPRENFSPPSEKVALNNIDNNIDKNTISKDIVSDTQKSEYESHMYSDSKSKTEKPKRLSLYDKCYNAIMEYTDDIELQNALVTYLGVRLAIKDKPIYGIGQWKGLLNKLDMLNGDKLKIVMTATEGGWASFFELHNNSYNGKKDVFSEGSGLSCEQSTTTSDERAETLAKQGKRAVF